VKPRPSIGSAVLIVLALGAIAYASLPRGTGVGGAAGSGENGWTRVVRVIDGDTVILAGLGSSRIVGVDTPETVKPDTPVQCFGPQASHFEHRRVEGRRVRLLTGVEPRDYYGRLLAYVWIERRFLESELLGRGLARVLTFHPNDRFAHRFEVIAQKAAKAGKGLWNAC